MGVLKFGSSVLSRPEALLGQLLATGEEASVALLCIALTSADVNAVSLATEQFRLRTHGALSDANPVAADSMMRPACRSL